VLWTNAFAVRGLVSKLGFKIRLVTEKNVIDTDAGEEYRDLIESLG